MSLTLAITRTLDVRLVADVALRHGGFRTTLGIAKIIRLELGL